ncbi:uncharacterized protein LOC144425918 isoform X2 [Styela clava]
MITLRIIVFISALIAKCYGIPKPDVIRCVSFGSQIAISGRRVCDGMRDCDEGEDEENCDQSLHPYDCAKREFQCSNGICLPKFLHCDGIEDCGDGSDETNCDVNMSFPKAPCELENFDCGDGMCIPASFVCDDEADCVDGEDEVNCTAKEHMVNKNADRMLLFAKLKVHLRFEVQGFSRLLRIKPCTESEFRCGNGDCINRLFVCDHYGDCNDGSDEFNCTKCKSGEFECWGDGSCIPEKSKCNYNRDCDDGSDEISCPEVDNSSCDEFLCNTNECIPYEQACDGIQQCSDGTDEKDCKYAGGCPPNHFKCNNTQCRPDKWKCDGIDDCGDKSDEIDCPYI